MLVEQLDRAGLRVKKGGGQLVQTFSQRGPGDRERVDLVALAALPGTGPGPGGQPGRDPDHALAARDQKPLQATGDVTAVLNGPGPLGVKAARPLQQRTEALLARRHG